MKLTHMKIVVALLILGLLSACGTQAMAVPAPRFTADSGLCRANPGSYLRPSF